MPDAAPTPTPGEPPHANVFTTNLPQILRALPASLFVTTYQRGRLIIVRPEGAMIHTHFVRLNRPMGLACNGVHLAVGTKTGIRTFRNAPEVATRLEPPGVNDAVFAFRDHHHTGEIIIHELAFGERDELWYVNTLFSCLCSLDREHSFAPRWRPKFITGLSPEDRCHLNGLAMADGKPRWLTALGATDTAQGWRANKKDGGVLLDYETRDVVVGGLSMPHSPRWYRGRLWVLESGRGSLAVVDLLTGRIETVARVPGFTRGLSFIGPLAFIGLSQLRQTNSFTEIPITDENLDRASGVWVVNIETGKTIAFLKFKGLVEEIFAVEALPGMQAPMVVDEESESIDNTYFLSDDVLKDFRPAPPAPGSSSPAA